MKRAAIIVMILSVFPAVATAAQPFNARGAFLAVSVPDLEASVIWYTEKLGLSVVERPSASDKVKVAILEGGGLIVELIQHAEATPRAGMPQGIFKAGVVVRDFDAAVAALKERGVDIAFGPYPARGKQRANVIIRDRDGNLIQLFGE